MYVRIIKVEPNSNSDIEQCIDTELIPQHIKLRRTTLELEKNLKTKRNTLNLHTKTVEIENENKLTDNGDLDFSSKEKLINFLSMVSDACKHIEPNTYPYSNSIWPMVGSEEFENFAVTGAPDRNELVDNQESKSVSYSIDDGNPKKQNQSANEPHDNSGIATDISSILDEAEEKIRVLPVIEPPRDSSTFTDIFASSSSEDDFKTQQKQESNEFGKTKNQPPLNHLSFKSVLNSSLQFPPKPRASQHERSLAQEKTLNLVNKHRASRPKRQKRPTRNFKKKEKEVDIFFEKPIQNNRRNSNDEAKPLFGNRDLLYNSSSSDIDTDELFS